MKPVILAIPGLDGNPALIEHLLSASNHAALVYDHRSDAGEGGFEGLADRALVLLDQTFGSDTAAIICGESFGGGVALTLARRHARRVRGLLLMSTFAWYPWPNRAFAQAGMFGWRLLGDPVAELVLRMGRSLTPLVELSATASLGRWSLAPTDLAGFRAKCQLALDFDARDWIQELDVPTLILSGRYDPVVPVSAAQVLAKSLPRASWRQLRGGHVAHLSRPAHTQQLIASWVDQLLIRGAADIEALEVLERLVPVDLDLAHPRAGGAALAPAQHVLDS